MGVMPVTKSNYDGRDARFKYKKPEMVRGNYPLRKCPKKRYKDK